MDPPTLEQRLPLQHDLDWGYQLELRGAGDLTMITSAKMEDAQRLAESCRVTFDLERIRANIESGLDGEHVTEGDVHDWLEALGFSPSTGNAWIGRRKTLRHFAEGEVVSFDDLR